MQRVQKLPDHLTKVSFILPKKNKSALESVAKTRGVSMSTVIADALDREGIFQPTKARPKRKAVA